MTSKFTDLSNFLKAALEYTSECLTAELVALGRAGLGADELPTEVNVVNVHRRLSV